MDSRINSAYRQGLMCPSGFSTSGKVVDENDLGRDVDHARINWCSLGMKCLPCDLMAMLGQSSKSVITSRGGGRSTGSSSSDLERPV